MSCEIVGVHVAAEKARISSYKDLDVWRKAIVLAEECYRKTKTFPREEAYGMTSQNRRSAVSIATNIAEGFGRDQTGSFIQFLRIALGSARELETHLIIATKVDLIDAADAASMSTECDDICKMLRSLIRALEAKKNG